MNFIKVLTLMIGWIVLVWSKVIVDVNEEVFDCENSLPNSAVDFSGLEYELDDKDELTLNGQICVNEDYEAPIGLNFYTRHLEHGRWNVGLFSMMVKDFCPDLLNPTKPWYFITKTLNQTQCPYKKGHIEILDHMRYGTYGAIIPFNMLGEWKFFFEISAKRNGAMIMECNMLRVFLTDG
ncbi:uncharacterized protein LOC120430681 [Culex pipiens pallens]|uniref:uncharacterized protein LOC120430681 n=1 Tax=Culex pipiens pallens TaxID=42434 RepID=UPI0022AA481B|nr:uncharacterized protein LOC120430681 [Culex pipiens pallens]